MGIIQVAVGAGGAGHSAEHAQHAGVDRLGHGQHEHHFRVGDDDAGFRCLGRRAAGQGHGGQTQMVSDPGTLDEGIHHVVHTDQRGFDAADGIVPVIAAGKPLNRLLAVHVCATGNFDAVLQSIHDLIAF